MGITSAVFFGSKTGRFSFSNKMTRLIGKDGKQLC